VISGSGIVKKLAPEPASRNPNCYMLLVDLLCCIDLLLECAQQVFLQEWALLMSVSSAATTSRMCTCVCT